MYPEVICSTSLPGYRSLTPVSFMAAVCTHLDVSLDWRLTREGSMHRSVSAELSERRTVNQQEDAILELFRALAEVVEREVLSFAEEKKRLLDVE